MKAVILAGGGKGLGTAGFNEKATIAVKGKAMISYVIEALEASSYIKDILVIGDKYNLQDIIQGGTIKLLGGYPSILANLKYGVNFFEDAKRLLIISCDIPLITGQAIDQFVQRTHQGTADIYYPVINKKLYLSFYPDIKRTYVTLKEGKFTGGNMLLMSPGILEKIEDPVEQLIKYRKRPLRMAQVFGVKSLLKLLFRQLSIGDLEGYIGKRFDIKARAIISDFPQIANDIDRSEDIYLLEKYL